MNVLRLSAVVAVVMLALGNMACGQTDHDSGKVSVDPNTLARLGAVDERYQSYNVEMLEVTGAELLEALRCRCGRDRTVARELRSGGHGPRRLSIPAADRLDQRPSAHAGRGARPGLRPG